jgi:HEPN domain-containing protein
MSRSHRKSSQFALAAVRRLEDARALLKERRYHATVYMAGYVLECALKAVLFRYKPGDIYATHDLRQLADAIAVRERLKAEPRLLAAFDHMAAIWDVSLRYGTGEGYRTTATKAVADVADLRQWIAGQFREGML